jgi:hypothetical protein
MGVVMLVVEDVVATFHIPVFAVHPESMENIFEEGPSEEAEHNEGDLEQQG